MPSGYPIELERGARYGRLVTTGFSMHDDHQKRIWEATCDCGNTTFVTAHDVVQSRVVSCGCYREEALARQAARLRGKKNFKGGSQ